MMTCSLKSAGLGGCFLRRAWPPDSAGETAPRPPPAGRRCSAALGSMHAYGSPSGRLPRAPGPRTPSTRSAPPPPPPPPGEEEGKQLLRSSGSSIPDREGLEAQAPRDATPERDPCRPEDRTARSAPRRDDALGHYGPLRPPSAAYFQSWFTFTAISP